MRRQYVSREVALLLLVVLLVFAVIGLTFERSGGPEIETKNVQIKGFYLVEDEVNLPTKPLNYTIEEEKNVIVTATLTNNSIVLKAIPDRKVQNLTDVKGSSKVVITLENGKIVTLNAKFEIFVPETKIEAPEKTVMLRVSKPYVVLNFTTRGDFNYEIHVKKVSGRGVRTADFLNGRTLKVLFDLKELPYVGYEEIEVYGVVTVSKDGISTTIEKSWKVGFNFVNLYHAGVNDMSPIKVEKPALLYYDAENGKYVYAFKVLNNASQSLILSVDSGCVSTYPFYYGEFPECWKAIIYSVYQKVYVSSFGGNVVPGASSICQACSSEVCNKVYPVAPKTESVVYYVIDNPVNGIEMSVKTVDGILLQRVEVDEVKRVEYFPTFPAERVWSIVSKYMPVVLATGSDGAPLTPTYFSVAPVLINSPVPSRVAYNMKLYALVPDSMTGYSVKFVVLAPFLGEVKTIYALPSEKIGYNYTVYTADVKLPGDVFGLLPVDVVLFIDEKPVVVEHTYLTFANIRGGENLPKITYANATRVIDYNALEIVKFWGYGVALLKSDQTVLTKGGYIMKNDASVTLRLEKIALLQSNGTATPDVPPYSLFNITKALKIMFFGDTRNLDAVGVYSKVGNVTKDKLVPVTPIAYTIQPKYAFIDALKKNPAKFIKTYQTLINGTPKIVVSNPTPYSIVVNNEKFVKPFSLGIFDNVSEVRVLKTNATVSFSGVARPLKLVPSNITVERVLKNSRNSTNPFKFTIVEVPFTPDASFPTVEKVIVEYDGKTATAKIKSPSEAMLTIKQMQSGYGSDPVAYFTVFNDRLVLNVVVPGKPAELKLKITTSDGEEYDIEYSGAVTKAIEELGSFDVSPLPNFYSYYLTSFRPIYFDPVEHNPYHEGNS